MEKEGVHKKLIIEGRNMLSIEFHNYFLDNVWYNTLVYGNHVANLKRFV